MVTLYRRIIISRIHVQCYHLVMMFRFLVIFFRALLIVIMAISLGKMFAKVASPTFAHSLWASQILISITANISKRPRHFSG